MELQQEHIHPTLQLDPEPAINTSPFDNVILPKWSHTARIKRRRYLQPTDPQSKTATATPISIRDIIGYIKPWLTNIDISKLESTCHYLATTACYHDMWITRPWCPHRRRRWGFGIPTNHRNCLHKTPNPKIFIHFMWLFLSPIERKKCSEVCLEWELYPHLCFKAATTPIHWIKHRRDDNIPTTLTMERALAHAMILLRFDFIYGDMHRWMSGEYTNRNRDWDNEWRSILQTRERDLPRDYPPPDYHRAFRVTTEGAPLKGTFVTDYKNVPQRLQ